MTHKLSFTTRNKLVFSTNRNKLVFSTNRNKLVFSTNRNKPVFSTNRVGGHSVPLVYALIPANSESFNLYAVVRKAFDARRRGEGPAGAGTLRVEG